MHKKEKELLAVLGVILSIAFWVVAIHYTLNNPISSSAESSGKNNISNGSTSTPEQQVALSEADKKLKQDSKKYTDKIVGSLVKEANYAYVYNCFDSQIKMSYFGNSDVKAYKTLQNFIGYMGKATEYTMTNQNLNEKKDSITSYYFVTYGKQDGSTTDVAIEVFVKITNNKLSLFGFKTQPI